MITSYPAVNPVCDRIVLVGAGRNAHNLGWYFQKVGIAITAVLDDRPAGEVLGVPVTPINEYAGPVWNAWLTIIGDPELRQTVSRRPALARCVWTSFVHPQSAVSPYATIGEGVMVAAFVCCGNVTLGRLVTVLCNSVLGARARIGDFTLVGPNATVASDATVGSRCMIGMGARISAAVRIGDDCRIAPNTYVHHDMPDGTMAVPSGRGTRIFKRRQIRSISTSAA